MFSFLENVFSKIYGHFPISAIFGEFGVIVIFAKNNFFGDVISLMGLEKIFSYIELVFQPSGNLGLIFF